MASIYIIYIFWDGNNIYILYNIHIKYIFTA